jgi:hypothetical protein
MEVPGVFHSYQSGFSRLGKFSPPQSLKTFGKNQRQNGALRLASVRRRGVWPKAQSQFCAEILGLGAGSQGFEGRPKGSNGENGPATYR